MTLRDMMYMTVIAEEKSITKAAARLYVAQPALSQCVQKVERELGTLVFVRGNNGVILTAEGACYIEFAKDTLMRQKNFEKRLSDLRNAERGEIHLGFTGTQATYVLPYFLPAFKEKYPQIKIVLLEANSGEIENKLVKGELDLGILHPPLIHGNLDTFEISRDEMVIVPRSNSRFQPFIYYMEGDTVPYLDMEFLRNEPLVLTQPWQRSRMVSEQIFHKAKIEPVIKQLSRNLSTLDALAQVDYATTLLPSKQVSEEIRRRGYYKINPKYSVPYTFDVATLHDTYLSTAARKLLEHLRAISGTF